MTPELAHQQAVAMVGVTATVLTAGVGGVIADAVVGEVLAHGVVNAALGNPGAVVAATVAVGEGASAIASNGGAPSPSVGSAAATAETEAASYGPFHRLGDSAEAIDSIKSSGELRGNPPTNFFQSDIPKVKAYDGPLLAGAKGFEFTTPIAPDVGHVPGKPTWSPSTPGVSNVNGQAVIPCTVTKC
jgi:hypothetical protein